MSAIPSLAAIDAGLYYHQHAIHHPPFKDFFAATPYLRDVPATDLTKFDTVLILCRTNAFYLAPLADQFMDFMKKGGRLVVMGETFPDRWLPNIHFNPVNTNFWWWLEEGADLGIQIRDQYHPMSEFVDKQAATWHIHGTFDPLASSQKSLIETAEGGCLMFEDCETYAPGRLIVTSLDPFFHHGSYFMPATTFFLDRFLTWLKQSYR